MAIIGKLNSLTIECNSRIIVEKANAAIQKQARIAVIGANGTGKTSLLEAIARNENGIQWIGGAPEIVYMEQEVKELDPKHLQVDVISFYSKWRIPEDRKKLSGGEMMKLRLAQTLSRTAGLYLLDEPTNHLDEESLELLAAEVENIDGTVIFVSHDRHFIDQVATHIWEIEENRLTVYEGNYSASRAEKEHHLLTQTRKYNKQQAKIALVESQLENLQSWSDKAHAESTKKDGAKEYFRVKAKKKDVQIRSKRKRLQAELDRERVDKPIEETRVSFKVIDAAQKGRRVIELKDAGNTAGDRVLFEKSNFTVQHGEKLGLLGKNGSGKTTLFKMLLGLADYRGEVWLSQEMKIGYLSQDVFDLPEDKTPSELFLPKNYEEAGEIRNLMTHLGFDKVHWGQQVVHMSMGERVKLKLMEFILSRCNVLLLDEPTNHLDLPSREGLERALQSFGGTMLIATHDRYFIERLSHKLLVFEEGRLSKYEGGYTEWRQRKAPDKQVDLLKLERERQEVLGKLSFLKPDNKDYGLLDKRYNELTASIQSIKAMKK